MLMTMRRRWYGLLLRWAYPPFECEDCFGSRLDAGGACQCAAYDASGPCLPPTRRQLWALWVLDGCPSRRQLAQRLASRMAIMRD